MNSIASNTTMTDEQRYLFDTFGYLVIPGALPASTVARLKDSLRQPTEQFDPVDPAESPLHWGREWRALLDVPVISALLEAVAGNHGLRSIRTQREAEADGHPAALPTFRLDHINVHTHVGEGFPGGVIHGGWENTGGSQFFRYHDGRFYNGLIAVAFELWDTHANGGGFGCVPGSHKSNLPFPTAWRDTSKGVHESITRIPASAGDAIFFTEALTHGTMPWTVPDTRQTLFYKFSPHGTSWSADFFDPEDYRQYDDMDDRKLAILEPPNARYQGRPTRPARR